MGLMITSMPCDCGKSHQLPYWCPVCKIALYRPEDEDKINKTIDDWNKANEEE